MAKEDRTNGVGNVPPTPQVAQSVRVEGWYSGWHADSATDWDDRPPPVIVNPSASPADLVAWATGQIEQANILMAFIGVAQGTGWEPDTVVGAVRHFTEQAQAVMAAAASALLREAGHA